MKGSVGGWRLDLSGSEAALTPVHARKPGWQRNKIQVPQYSMGSGGRRPILSPESKHPKL